MMRKLSDQEMLLVSIGLFTLGVVTAAVALIFVINAF